MPLRLDSYLVLPGLTWSYLALPGQWDQLTSSTQHSIILCQPLSVFLTILTAVTFLEASLYTFFVRCKRIFSISFHGCYLERYTQVDTWSHGLLFLHSDRLFPQVNTLIYIEHKCVIYSTVLQFATCFFISCILPRGVCSDCRDQQRRSCYDIRTSGKLRRQVTSRT